MDRIRLAHGGGGSLSRELVENVIVPATGAELGGYEDSSKVPGEADLRFTTDAFVVKPLFFPGGDIGSLAVHGTANDLAVAGARPTALSLSLIIEEGLEIETLEKVLDSVGKAAGQSRVKIVTGDTKVAAQGEVDKLFIVTSGVGRCRLPVNSSGGRPGDAVVLTGPIAEHGIAVMSAREGIAFETTITSDSAPVWPLVEPLIDEKIEIHAMRDPTRGGLAATCVELAQSSEATVVLEEEAIPVSGQVAAACEMLGLDPLAVANEGKVVLFVAEKHAEKTVEILKSIPGGERSSIIGRLFPRKEKDCLLNTRFGGRRIIEMPYGEQLPRIC